MNRAARIMGAANGGQVLVSDADSGLVEHMADLKLVDLGSIELKGVIEPVHVYGVAGDGHAWLDTPLLDQPTHPRESASTPDRVGR